MSFDSILREPRGPRSVYRRLAGRPASWHGLFNVPNLMHNLRVFGVATFAGCSVRRDGGELVCYPISFGMPREESLLVLADVDGSVLRRLVSYDPVTFRDPYDLLFYTHLDLVADYLSLEAEPFEAALAVDPRFVEAKRVHRPSLLQVNGNSVFLAAGLDGIASSRRIRAELRDAMQRLGVSSLELPEDYDPEKTIETLAVYDQKLTEMGFPDEERSFDLKFKKLGSYNASGFYSAELNIVIVDPREVDVFYHELGHLVFDRNIPLDVRIEADDSEAFARSLYELVVGSAWKGEWPTRI